jgi:CubicO group peptidase (beta-lactamase class C family)
VVKGSERLCALLHGGHVRYRQALGYADLETKVPVRRNTRFVVGSISKQFTAAAILMLARDGKLRLDDAASRFVPELPEYARGVTIRQLLHHTGGLREHEELLAGKIGREFFIASAASHKAPFTPPPHIWTASNERLSSNPDAACNGSRDGFGIHPVECRNGRTFRTVH